MFCNKAQDHKRINSQSTSCKQGVYSKHKQIGKNNAQGIPLNVTINQMEIAVALKQNIFDTMFAKPKCVSKVKDFLEKV